MRTILAFLLLALLVACSSENAIKDLPMVQLYIAMNDPVEYSEMTFSGAEARAIADLVTAECPQGVGEKFLRVTLDSPASTLTLYTSTDGKEVSCSLLKPKDAKPIVQKTRADAPSEDVAVVVNDKSILITQVQSVVAALPESTPRDVNTVALVVNRLINDELLRQAAASVIVSEEDVATVRFDLLKSTNLTEEQLAVNLATSNVSADQFLISLEQDAKLRKLLDEKLLLSDIAVSEDDAKNFYLQNPNQFLQSEQAVARLILISSAGRTLEQGQERAQELATGLNGTDFCQLVQKYSDDPQSKDKCGVYVIPRGVIDSTLEQAVFGTPANQTSVVTTAAGIYFVQTLQVTPAQVVPYPQVAGSLQSDLRNVLTQQRLNLYLITLRSNATIISYLG